MADDSSIDLQKWADAQETALELDVEGKIIDFLDPDKSRPDKPEERVRQLMARSLHFEYGYPKELMEFEVPIRKGSKDLTDRNGATVRADIVIYKTRDARLKHDQGGMNAIIETKHRDSNDGYNQLISYIEQTSADGGIWSNGRDIRFVRRIIIQLGKQEFKAWPGFPKHQQAWDSIGKCKKSKLVVPDNLKPKFIACHNAMYKSGINSEDVAIDMVRIILAKRCDELEPGEDCKFYCTPEEFATDEGKHIVAERVRELFSKVRNDNLDVFEEGETIGANDEQIATVVTYLAPYSFVKADLDVIGTAYEVYVASHLKGERGQYFTNRLLIKLMVNFLDPKEMDIILDPACGSGGFLLTSLNYVKNKVETSDRTPEAKYETITKFRHNLFGIDISPKLVKVAQANMLIGKDGHTGIIPADSISPIKDSVPEQFWKKTGFGKPSIILTNPPFGSSPDHKIKSAAKLAQFEIGHIWEKNDSGDNIKTDALATSMGRPPELLFLERCIQWVRPGGKIGIVMARGQLDGKEAQPLRNIIFKTCKVLAVINAHDDAFQPFCGSKASLIMLQKWGKDDDKTVDYNIFMGISKKIGQNSRGEPIFLKNNEGKRVVEGGALVLDHDIDKIIESYNNYRNGRKIEHEFCYSIKKSNIDKQTLSLNPVKYLPAYNDSIAKILKMGDDEENWYVTQIGSISQEVFNGPRFTRPYADGGVTRGEGILPYYTGAAMLQVKGDNIKYLDLNKANKTQKRQINRLKIHKDWILVTDSGTIGKVIYTLEKHDNVIATNNLVRIVIEDPYLRGYVYEFLQSPHGQFQMLKNTYGTNQDHLEPDHIRNIWIPIPKDENKLKEIGGNSLESIKLRQQSLDYQEKAKISLDSLIGAS